MGTKVKKEKKNATLAQRVDYLERLAGELVNVINMHHSYLDLKMRQEYQALQQMGLVKSAEKSDAEEGKDG